MAELQTLLKFEDVSLSFGGITALKNVSFDVKENSITSIIGPNGAGKTSVFNCISGIYTPIMEVFFLKRQISQICVQMISQNLDSKNISKYRVI